MSLPRKASSSIPFNGNLLDTMAALKNAFLKETAQLIVAKRPGTWDLVKRMSPMVYITFEDGRSAWLELEQDGSSFQINVIGPGGFKIGSTPAYTTRDVAAFTLKWLR